MTGATPGRDLAAARQVFGPITTACEDRRERVTACAIADLSLRVPETRDIAGTWPCQAGANYNDVGADVRRAGTASAAENVEREDRWA